MICFVGDSHAATTLAAAASARGLQLTADVAAAKLVFVSQDTPTDETGKRDVVPIRNLVLATADATKAPIVLTSQVPPGFTRNIGLQDIYHMAETLRIKDAEERALNPEQFIVGCPFYGSYELLPQAFREYLEAFGCPVQIMTYEDAEFAKIAINMMLAAQVEATNRLAAAARKADASWLHVAKVLKLDKRIGPHAYLEPGRWQDSRHLLRDHVTLEALLAR
jgi:UDPglucose 6-dehydrogenase